MALFNIFTIGVSEVALGLGNTILANETKSGFTTEVNVWIPGPGDSKGTIVFLNDIVYEPESNTAWYPNTDICRFILPPIMLPTPTTIIINPITTSVEVIETTIIDREVIFQTELTTVVIPTSIIVTNTISVSNVNVS